MSTELMFPFINAIVPRQLTTCQIPNPARPCATRATHLLAVTAAQRRTTWAAKGDACRSSGGVMLNMTISKCLCLLLVTSNQKEPEHMGSSENSVPQNPMVNDHLFL
jgi:hypothetical protein